MVYLAAPYSDLDPAVRECRFREISRAAAALMRAGLNVCSPISHSQPISQYLVPGDWTRCCMFLNCPAPPPQWNPENTGTDAGVMSFLLDTNIISAHLHRQGIEVSTTDLMLASIALEYDLTLVTHNIADFHKVPSLRLDDWLAS